MTRLAAAALALTLLTPACADAQRPPRRAAAAPVPSVLQTRVDSLVGASIRSRVFPAAAVAIGRAGQAAPVVLKAYGTFTYVSPERVTVDTPFDMASLTKVIATTTVAARFMDRGLLDLDAPLARYLPALDTIPAKRGITVRQVMTHSAGLRPFIPFYLRGIVTRDGILKAILDDSLVYTPGTTSRYSDFGYILLGLALEHIGGAPLDELARREVFVPLGMTHSTFRPVGAMPDAATVVPTEFDSIYRRRLVQGEVHDETAWTLGGVSGHAGLFSTARDAGKFAAMLLAGGRLPDGTVYLRPETMRLLSTREGSVSGSTRAIGWDTKSDTGYSSGGTKTSRSAFGHTGFTGTSLWVDPAQGFYVVLLTNRVYPTRDNSRIGPVRSQIADLASDAFRR